MYLFLYLIVHSRNNTSCNALSIIWISLVPRLLSTRLNVDILPLIYLLFMTTFNTHFLEASIPYNSSAVNFSRCQSPGNQLYFKGTFACKSICTFADLRLTNVLVDNRSLLCVNRLLICLDICLRPLYLLSHLHLQQFCLLLVVSSVAGVLVNFQLMCCPIHRPIY